MKESGGQQNRVKEVQDRRLKWYGHGTQRKCEGRSMKGKEVRRRIEERTERRWLDRVRNDTRENRVSGNDRATRETYIVIHRPHIKVELR